MGHGMMGGGMMASGMMAGGCAGMMQSMNGGDGRPNSQWQTPPARQRDAGLRRVPAIARHAACLLLLLALACRAARHGRRRAAGTVIRTARRG